MTFERDAEGRRSWVQTLEPRLLYVHVPFEDQSALPVFDTILPDFNLVQLFRKYQFVGPDRVADTDQLSFGVTTRLIDAANGRERLTASLGQTRYLNPQLVTLPGTAPTGTDASDYVAEVGIGVRDAWALDVGYQWNSETSSTARTETRLEFRPKEDRLFGIGYRYRRDALEQGDVSVVWPARAALAHHRQLQLFVPRQAAARGLRRLGIRGLLLAPANGQPQLREPPHGRVRQLDLDAARAEGPVAARDLAGRAPRPWYSGLSEYRESLLRGAIP